MPMFDESYFEPTFRDLFWQMITERMRVYWRRLEGMPPPWTNDPILRTEFITNVYRELDPGTQHIMTTVLQTEESVEDKVFNVMVYRLLGSRIETQKELGFLNHDRPLLVEYIEQTLKGIKERGTAPFGDAYRTAAYTDMGTKDKITNVARLCGQLASQVPQVWAELQVAINPEAAFKILNGIKGFGEFLAYQIMVDYLYPAPFDPILPFDQETWVMAGPGARRGLWQLLRPGMKPNSLLEVMKWLRDNQFSEFERLGLEFPYLRDETKDGSPIIPISLCNVQSCLCEFFKYSRIWTGQLPYARKYNYQERLVNQLDELPVTPPAQPGRVQSVGNVVVGAGGPQLPGSGEHGGLLGVAVAGGELLDLPGGQHGEGPSLAPHAPTDDTGQVVDVQVDELAASGARLHDDQVGGELSDELEERSSYGLDTLLKAQSSGGLDVQRAEHIFPVPRDGAGVAEGQIETYGQDVIQFTIVCNKRVRHISLDFD